MLAKEEAFYKQTHNLNTDIPKKGMGREFIYLNTPLFLLEKKFPLAHAWAEKI